MLSDLVLMLAKSMPVHFCSDAVQIRWHQEDCEPGRDAGLQCEQVRIFHQGTAQDWGGMGLSAVTVSSGVNN